MKLVKIVLGLVFTALIFGGGKACVRGKQKEVSIIGKRVTLTYPMMTAQVHYLSDKQLEWKTIDKEGNVATGKENISYKRLGPDKFFLNWIEEDGVTVSQVLDMKKKIITVFMSYADKEHGRGGRAAEFFEGTVKVNP